MFNASTSLLPHNRQYDSEDDCRLSDTDSDDDNEKKRSTTVEETQRSPPIITWKFVWPMSEIQHALSDSSFTNLPTEILIQIFQLLSVHDLTNISLVCRYFKVIADEDDIWRSKCNPLNEKQATSFKQIYMDWIYGKYLRSRDLQKVNNRYLQTKKHIPCLLNTCRCSSKHFHGTNDKAEVLSVPGFPEHPNSSSEMTVKLSVDIDRTVIALITLLEKISEFATSRYRPIIFKQMIMRYYRFMQLKALYPKERLVPALDIEIVWQTHLLRPDMYRGDCLRLFHRIIDHSLLIDNNEESLKEQAFINTCRLYEEHFGEEYCPLVINEEEVDTRLTYRNSLLNYINCSIPAYSYWDNTLFKFASELPNNYENPFSFVEEDISLDNYWFELYCVHMYEVGLAIMVYNSEAQENALQLAMKLLRKSYERFLYIAAKYSTIDGYDFIHPTYAMDIVWHSHMQEPLKYADDCNHLIGFVIDHVPWSSNVAENHIKESYEKLNEIWKIEFDRDMEIDHFE
ncbi:unnamed protein product [Adineta steineri]|uniref:F-box domain-containing protein n=1 Tax=Adineta steineri TaxID=433720 RepID=A0A815NP92_9BILA|nr:unnamed protein product [Adineta steineri]CAF3738985.1 unnamed protein product [Adineta steineri]